MQALPMTAEYQPQALALLRERRETSLFLLGNLEQHGPGPTANLNSGLYQVLVQDDAVKAVFVLTRRGNLLVQTDHQGDYGAQILDAVRPIPTPIQGLLGDWPVVEPLARQLEGFKPSFVSKERLFRRPAGNEARPAPPDGAIVRKLNVMDFLPWDNLMAEFRTEQKLPHQGTWEEREANFRASVALGRQWGAFVNARLLSVAGLNTIADGLGLVGGVYTTPKVRRMGLSKAVMQQLIADSAKLDALVLFTGEENVHAQAMYRNLGFEEIGHYGLILGG